MTKNTLFIGRFQPVHNGHVGVVKSLDKLGLEKIILGVGLEGNGRTERNPFTYEEICEMWNPIIGELTTKTEIYPLPDINNPLKYARHVESITGVTQEDTILVSSNQRTIDCFQNYGADYKVLEAHDVFQLSDRLVHGSNIRSSLKYGLIPRARIPESSVKVIEKFGIEELKKILSGESQDKVIYDGHVKFVHRYYGEKDWDVVVSKDACVIMYIDEQDNVWFAKQYRVPVCRTVTELPAETMDKPGKTSLQVIVEGLEEECGIKIDPSQVKYFTTLYSSEGHDTEKVDLFYAYGPHVKTKQRLEDHEKIEVVTIPFNQAYEMVKKGELTGSKTVALLQNEYIKRLEEH